MIHAALHPKNSPTTDLTIKRINQLTIAVINVFVGHNIGQGRNSKKILIYPKGW